MIYGLGDYSGGAICVEGTASDIRYAMHMIARRSSLDAGLRQPWHTVGI